MNDLDEAVLTGLGLALAIGMLIGLERGWHQRDLPDGHRVAGVRTFALLGLLGGIGGVLAQRWGHRSWLRCWYWSACCCWPVMW